ncbi:MAG TPA: haloacid dehalogenase type II [Streptosporangiaceae bacterium]
MAVGYGFLVANVIAFDVNETLLDLGALDGPFQDLLGSAALRPQWFALMLQLSFVGGITGRYVDFTAAQRGALAMLAEREGVPLSDGDIDGLVGRMRSLPPHPEVPGALATLARTSLRLVALTNSVQAVAEAQIAGAGLRDYFEAVISADTVAHLKPAPQPYQAVADRCGVSIGDVRLVAAHHWDIAGALSAGCQAAFVARPGMVLSPLADRPDIVGPDLAAVAEQIIATDA